MSIINSTPIENPTPAQAAYNMFLRENDLMYRVVSFYIEKLNELFYSPLNQYKAQDVWNVIGTDGAVSLQEMQLLIQLLTIANPAYIPPVIPDTLTANADGTVTDTPITPTN